MACPEPKLGKERKGQERAAEAVSNPVYQAAKIPHLP